MPQKKYSLFHLQGGFGKHIAATAVAKCIKNNFPSRELIVTGVSHLIHTINKRKILEYFSPDTANY